MPRDTVPRTRVLLIRLLVIATCLTPLDCGERERFSQPPQTSEGWSLGESKSYVVNGMPGARIEDAATGQLFEFPEGGGDLTVTPILSGPEVGSSDSAFEIEYSGTGPVELLIVPAEDDIDIVLRHAPFDLIIQEGDVFEESGWIPITFEEAAPDTLSFVLLPSDDDLDDDRQFATTRISKFRHIRAKTTDPYPLKLANFKANVKLAVDELVLAVADHRRPEVERAISGILKYEVHLRERAKISAAALPCYAPFYSEDLRWFVACGLMMIDDSPESIAHETGHYFHHVLVQTAVYRTFVPRPAGHKLGMLGAKNNLIEEPAYYAEYYLKGTVGGLGGFSPERGTFLSSLGISPATTDFLDVEGFATAVLATLTRTDTTIQDFENKSTPVPVLDGDVLARFQAGFEIIAKGTNSIAGVHEELSNYLFVNGGQDDKLPAMLEPIGWSHKVTCRFIDSAGEGVAGVSARPFYKVDGVTYYLPSNGTTDDSGTYTLPRAFPGEGKLRFYYNNDSTDVDCSIPWTTPTNQVRARGDIVVENAIDLNLARYGNIDLRLYCQYSDSYYSPRWATFGPWGWQQSSEGGNDFTGTRDVIDYGYRMVEELNVSVDPRSGLVTEYQFIGTYSSTVNSAVRVLEFKGSNVPMNSYTLGEDTVFYVAHATGEVVCTDLEEFSEVSDLGDGRVVTITDYDCEGVGSVSEAKITITLSSNPGK